MLHHRFRPSGVLDVAGPDRVAFLQGQLTQDVGSLAAGEVRPAAGLTAKGKLLYVARLVGGPERLRLLVPADLRQAVTAHLGKYAAFQKVTVSDGSDDWLRIGLYGAFPVGAPAPPGALRLPGEGEFSQELLVPARESEAASRWLAAAGSSPVAPDDAEAWRVEAGRPRFGQDMDGSNLPDEVGLEGAISRTKGCYVGQEVVARLSTYGRVNRRLVGFLFPDGPLPAGARLRPAAPPAEGASDKIEWGRVTSSAISPRLGPIGLGFAFRDVPAGGRLLGEGDPGRAAIVSELPFA